jgi:hypothetical protein
MASALLRPRSCSLDDLSAHRCWDVPVIGPTIIRVARSGVDLLAALTRFERVRPGRSRDAATTHPFAHIAQEIRLPGGVIPDDKAAQLAFLAPQLLLRSASAWAIADDPVLAITHHDR